VYVCVLSFLFSCSLVRPIPPHTHSHTHSHPPTPSFNTIGGFFWKRPSIHTHTHTPEERVSMVRRDGAEVRKERIQEIARSIHSLLVKSNGELSLKQTMAKLEYETGLTPEKISEYVSILENMGQFIVDKERAVIQKIVPAAK